MVCQPSVSMPTKWNNILELFTQDSKCWCEWRAHNIIIPGTIIGDGDRMRGVHAAPSKKTNVLFLEKIAPPSMS